MAHMRAVLCNICGGKYFPASLPIHQKACKKKFDLSHVDCTHCGRPISNDQWSQHIEVCKTLPGMKKTIKPTKAPVNTLSALAQGAADGTDAQGRFACVICNRKFTRDRINNHETICRKRAAVEAITSGKAVGGLASLSAAPDLHAPPSPTFKGESWRMPKGAGSTDRWRCKTCTFTNPHDAPTCATCNAQKPTQGAKTEDATIHKDAVASKPTVVPAVVELDVESAREDLLDALSELQVNTDTDSAAHQVALERLGDILDNLLQYPQEKKFQRLRLDNAVFHQGVARHSGGLQFLRALSFDQKDKDGKQFVQLRAVHLPLLTIARTLLLEHDKARVQRLEAAAAAAAAASVAVYADASEDGGGEDGRLPCNICGRKFNKDRIAKHETVCNKPKKRKLKVWDGSSKRVEGTVFEEFKDNRSKTPPKQTRWRREREEFRSIIEQGKVVNQFQQQGRSLKDLPPPPKSEPNPDYVQCPHCSRRFNQIAAEKHVASCKNVINKPKPPPTVNRFRPAHSSANTPVAARGVPAAPPKAVDQSALRAKTKSPSLPKSAASVSASAKPPPPPKQSASGSRGPSPAARRPSPAPERPSTKPPSRQNSASSARSPSPSVASRKGRA
eukprot:GILK01005854.1.p1 GENE.GILK01005854.1~~GILK01005854.1.p1  ORF type:complete len:632 (-),score=100.75 GILK01005854.1:118-1968(-)